VQQVAAQLPTGPRLRPALQKRQMVTNVVRPGHKYAIRADGVPRPPRLSVSESPQSEHTQPPNLPWPTLLWWPLKSYNGRKFSEFPQRPVSKAAILGYRPLPSRLHPSVARTNGPNACRPAPNRRIGCAPLFSRLATLDREVPDWFGDLEPFGKCARTVTSPSQVPTKNLTGLHTSR